MSAPSDRMASIAKDQSSLGKRKANLKAREVISTFAADNEKNDDDDLYDLSDREKFKPPKKRVKIDYVAKKTSSTTASSGSKPIGVYIGTVKKGDDNLPVRAEQYTNGTVNYRVYRDDISAEVAERQGSFLSTKRQVLLDEVVYDQTLFPSGLNVPDIQTQTDQQNRARIRSYLASVVANNSIAQNSGAQQLLPPQQLVEQPATIFEAVTAALATSQSQKVTEPDPIVTTQVATSQVIDDAIVIKPVATNQVVNDPGAIQPIATNLGIANPVITDPVATNPVVTDPVVANPVATKPGADLQRSPKKVNRSVSKKKTKTKSKKIDYSIDLLVGAWKMQPHVDVYAFLKSYAATSKQPMTLETVACFRVHPQENDEDTREIDGFPTKTETVRFAEIDFKAKFLAEDESATRALMKAILELRREARKQQQKQAIDSGAAEADEYIPDSIEVDEAKRAAQLARKNLLGQKQPMSQSLATRRSTRNKEPGVIEDEDSGAESEIFDFADAAAAKKVVDDRDTEIKRLTKENNAQAKKLARLENEVLKLKGQDHVPTTFLGSERIGGDIYHLMGSGPNPGKLTTKQWKKVSIGGTTYKEWSILSQFRLDMGNTKEMTETREVFGLTNYLIPDGKNQGKWVSEQTFLEVPEGKYVKWVVREEVVEEEGGLIL